MLEGDVRTDEPDVVLCAREVTDGARELDQFDPVFARSTVFGRRPVRPGVDVVDVAGRGAWTFVYSTPERLAARFGDCHFYAITGADLLEQLPVGIGVMLDADDAHRLPILNRMVPPKVLAAMRRQARLRRAQPDAATSDAHDKPSEDAR